MKRNYEKKLELYATWREKQWNNGALYRRRFSFNFATLIDISRGIFLIGISLDF